MAVCALLQYVSARVNGKGTSVMKRTLLADRLEGGAPRRMCDTVPVRRDALALSHHRARLGAWHPGGCVQYATRPLVCHTPSRLPRSLCHALPRMPHTRLS